jgi:hypothetical protein
MKQLGLGFRVKSGYAIAVALRGPAAAPSVAARLVVELSDPAVPATRQPYHDGFYKRQDDPRELSRLVALVKRCAAQSLDALLKDERLAGPRCRVAGVVVGSVIDPQRVGNLHIRAHASEGQLFRTVLVDALTAHAIASDVIVDRMLAKTAAKGLRRPDAAIARAVAALGKTYGGTWRAEEKAACTAAWLALKLGV